MAGIRFADGVTLWAGNAAHGAGYVLLMDASGNPIVFAEDAHSALKVALMDTSGNPIVPVFDSHSSQKVALMDTSGNPIVPVFDSHSSQKMALMDASGNPIVPVFDSHSSQKILLVDSLGNALIVPNVQKDLNALTITTITTVWSPGTGKKFLFSGGVVSASSAGSILFEDNSGGNTVFRTPKLQADTPYNFVVLGGQGVVSAAANNVLKATLSVAGAVTGSLWGMEV